MKLYHDDNWLIFKIALLLGLTLFLSAWHFCDNVHAEVYKTDLSQTEEKAVIK